MQIEANINPAQTRSTPVNHRREDGKIVRDAKVSHIIQLQDLPSPNVTADRISVIFKECRECIYKNDCTGPQPVLDGQAGGDTQTLKTRATITLGGVPMANYHNGLEASATYNNGLVFVSPGEYMPPNRLVNCADATSATITVFDSSQPQT